jgi:multicomponent Na+:H+ antiporter subunit E
MSQRSATESPFFVFVTPGRTATSTVSYALRGARDSAAELGSSLDVEIVIITSPRQPDGRETEDAVHEWISTAGQDLSSNLSISVRSYHAADSAYSPHSFAESDRSEDSTTTDWVTTAVFDFVGDGTVSHVVVPPDAGFSVERLRERFGSTTVDVAPSARTTRHGRLRHSGGLRRLATVFAASYVFYLSLGGFTGGLDLVTGGFSSAVVALSLFHVAFTNEPRLTRTGKRLTRTLISLPLFLWEVVKANLAIAYLILQPRLPIEPSVTTLETDTRDDLERMVLANSITLTPGTVAIDVDGSEFTVHALTPASRDALERGRLQRLVAWVFHGRANEDESR